MHADELTGGLPCAVTGIGPPLVVLPGLSRYSEIGDAKAYRPLAATTQRTIYVVGRPRALPRGISMRAMAAIHATALQERFGRQVDVIGVSTGGAIALQLAADHPEVVGCLIIAAAASWLGDEAELSCANTENVSRRAGAARVFSRPSWRRRGSAFRSWPQSGWKSFPSGT